MNKTIITYFDFHDPDISPNKVRFKMVEYGDTRRELWWTEGGKRRMILIDYSQDHIHVLERIGADGDAETLVMLINHIGEYGEITNEG